jgi:hypothetical protein
VFFRGDQTSWMDDTCILLYSHSCATGIAIAVAGKSGVTSVSSTGELVAKVASYDTGTGAAHPACAALIDASHT